MWLKNVRCGQILVEMTRSQICNGSNQRKMLVDVSKTLFSGDDIGIYTFECVKSDF
jgi:hypothetical protein